MKTPIKLNSFLRMTPETPEYTPTNQHYLIAGANPTYYNDTPGIQEQQLAPLAASASWQKVTATLDGNVIATAPASAAAASNFSVFVMTSTSQVFGVTVAGGVPTGVTSLGYPGGSALSGVARGQLTSVNGYLYATVNLTVVVYKMNNFTTPNWTSFGSIIIGVSTFLLPFLEFCMITTQTAVKKIDSAFNILTGIDLGVGWQILGTENLNDKYMVIAAVRSNFRDYTENYLFLWDGISDRYNYSARIPGSYLNMRMIDGDLNMAVALSASKTTMYTLNGVKLRELFKSPYSIIDGAEFGFVPEDTDAIFNFKGATGVRLKTNADMINPLLIFQQLPTGTKSFILSSGNVFSQFCLGADGVLYAFENIPGGNDNIFYYPDTATAYQPILYRSHWIPVKNLAGIDIRYENPPQASTDAINVTLYGKGTDIIVGSQVIPLDPITPTNFLTQRRTRLDAKGFDGSHIKVELSTVNTGAWRPIIRGIELL